MMILNLINVIAIAMGIGTSAKNTNFDYEKKARRNAAEDLAVDETYEYGGPQQSIRVATDPSRYAVKYSLVYGAQPQETRYVNITDSYYGYQSYYNQPYDHYFAVQIIKINNYYNSELTFNMTLTLETNGNTVNYKYNLYDVTNVDLNNYYNMTLTQNAGVQINDLITAVSTNGTWKIGNSYDTNATTINAYGVEYHLIPRETIQLAFIYEIVDNNQNIGLRNLRPKNINYTGYIIAIDNHTEVVDIPALMFTILTLPFSFISQAFDLTIFPDTPYQINFTNLFLTLISIFILIWIIKHIVK